jgi:SAM-dependent methyltransferase
MTMKTDPHDSARVEKAPEDPSCSSEQSTAPTTARNSSPRQRGMSHAIYRATWGRGFAVLYDTAFLLAERRGLRTVRKDLIGRAAGRVVEIGAGTGLNIRHYQGSVTELHLAEPDPHMATTLRKRVGSLGLQATVVEAAAEDLPFDDDSVDTVVSTLVLCTVRDPQQALAEMTRVLRPGGVLLFAEHIRSASPRAARWQDRLNGPWGWYACGCHCNRDTVSNILAASFETRDVTRDRLRWISPLVRPLVVGTASPCKQSGSP